MPVKARAFALARLLLNRLGIITSALTLASMSACVLPLAPEFQDPATSQNTPPIIRLSDPPLGEIVAGMTTPTQSFSVTVTDQNGGDTLYVRWMADYPPYSSEVTRLLVDHTILPSPDGTPLVTDDAIMVNCALSNLSPTVARHQVFVIVADRPFEDPATTTPNDYALVPSPGIPVTGTWIWEHQCP